MQMRFKIVFNAICREPYRLFFHLGILSGPFYAPLKTARILGSSIEKAQEARLLLVRVLVGHGIKEPIPPPDIATKQKAQKFIGLDMEKLKADKKTFLETVVPVWDGEKKNTLTKLI